MGLESSTQHHVLELRVEGQRSVNPGRIDTGSDHADKLLCTVWLRGHKILNTFEGPIPTAYDSHLPRFLLHVLMDLIGDINSKRRHQSWGLTTSPSKPTSAWDIVCSCPINGVYLPHRWGYVGQKFNPQAPIVPQSRKGIAPALNRMSTFLDFILIHFHWLRVLLMWRECYFRLGLL